MNNITDDEDGKNVIQPPNSFTVNDKDTRPVLYLSNGTPLVKRPIGFCTVVKTPDK